MTRTVFRARWLITRAGVSVVVGALWVIGWASPVGAHAELIDASPAPGTGLAQAPAEVVIRFSEPLNLSLSRIVVVDEGGADVGDGPTLPVEGDDQAMRRRLGLLEPGRYTVRWTSVSPLDGHTLRGSYAFGVGTSTVGDEVVRSNPLDSEGPLGLGGRWVLLSGLALWAGAVAVGSVGTRTSVDPKRLQVLHRGGTAAAALGSLAVAVATALVASGAIGDVDVVLTDSQSGRYRLAVIVLASVAVMLPRSWRWPDRLLLAGAVLAEAASGHAASSPAPLVATVVFAVHLVAVGVWVFAIASSFLAGRRLLDALAAYFPFAAAAAGVVVLSGVAAAALELTAPRDLVDTGYGQTVAAKAVLLLTMAALGVAHHRRRTRATTRLVAVRRRVVTELGVAGLAIVLATVLVAFPNPPREVARAEQHGPSSRPLGYLGAEPAVSVAAADGPFIVGISILPPEPGHVVVRVDVVGAEPGAGLRQATLRATSAEHGSVDVDLEACGFGCFEAPVELGRGTWELTASLVSNRAPIQAAVVVPLPTPDGAGELDRALAALEELGSARMVEELRGEEDGPPLVARYQFRAPNAMRIDIDDRASRVVIGERSFRRADPAAPWEGGSWPSGFEWPVGYYREFWSASTAIRVLGEDEVDGVPSRVVAFVDPDVAIWFRVWIGVDDGLIRRVEMRAERHLMEQSIGAFDEPVEIAVPPGP